MSQPSLSRRKIMAWRYKTGHAAAEVNLLVLQKTTITEMESMQSFNSAKECCEDAHGVRGLNHYTAGWWTLPNSINLVLSAVFLIREIRSSFFHQMIFPLSCRSSSGFLLSCHPEPFYLNSTHSFSQLVLSISISVTSVRDSTCISGGTYTC